MIFATIRANLYKYLSIALAIVALGALGYGAWNKFKRTETALEAQQYKSQYEATVKDLEGFKTSLSDLQKQVEINQDILKQQETKITELEQKHERIRRQLRGAIKQDPSGWGSQPIPDSVRNILSGTSPSDSEAVPARKPDPTLPRAK